MITKIQKRSQQCKMLIGKTSYLPILLIKFQFIIIKPTFQAFIPNDQLYNLNSHFSHCLVCCFFPKKCIPDQIMLHFNWTGAVSVAI